MRKSVKFLQCIETRTKIPVDEQTNYYSLILCLSNVLHKNTHLGQHTICCANLYFGVKMLTSERTNGQTKWRIEEFTHDKQLLELKD